jgi:hypothetical protein
MSDDDLWKTAAIVNDWVLPMPANWFLRLPIIRNFRAAFLLWQVERHNEIYRSIGMIPQGYDEWVIYAIWKGRC